MKETTGQKQPKRRGRQASDAPEMRVVGIDFKPAPDAEDRLRRLFTILARVMEDEPPTPGTEWAPDRPPAGPSTGDENE